jgi:hypothetical protein
MQQCTRMSVEHGPYGSDPYVSPVRAVQRVRFRTRLRRARTDFLPLYVGAGVAGVVTGFLLSII